MKKVKAAKTSSIPTVRSKATRKLKAAPGLTGLPDEITIRDRETDREGVVKTEDYVRSKTRNLKDFGYTNLTEDEVRSQIIAVDVRISEELFTLFHEGLMMGHSHGPSGEYHVEIGHRTLEQHQKFYRLLYELFNPAPLECPMCGTQKAFSIYPYDPSTGYCSSEDKTWTIRSIAARFTDQELEYIYERTDCDADRELFKRIEVKIRNQIAKYREFDRKHGGPDTSAAEPG